MTSPAWQPNEVAHTFTTGRTMVIRRAIPAVWLASHAIRTGGAEDESAEALAALMSGETAPNRLAALDLIATLVETMFLRPRVVWDPEGVPDPPRDQAGELVLDANGFPPVIWAGDLHQPEIDEVIDLGLKGVADASTFRGDDSGNGHGPDGAGVGNTPKRRTRAAAGKR
ncbi:MAG TPA: hypothetical protein VNT51_05880 [Miltoncostaeaceae bacterium]|nr:hypothetical protein [Miltoncostaeaceae bacterium]